MKEQIYKVVDVETGNYCIYEGKYLSEAYESIRDNGKDADGYGEDFTDSELWELYDDDERIWCGKTDTIAELVNLRYPEPAFGKKVEDYVDTLYNGGGDPTLIETLEDAISMFLSVNNEDTEFGLFDANEADEENLDLLGLEHDTIHFFKEKGDGCWTSICFDWN